MKLKNLLFLTGLTMLFSLRSWADNEPSNNTYAGADVAALNVAANGTIGNMATDPDDYIKITTTVDGAISVSAVLTGGSGYFYLNLYDNDGTTVLAGAANYTGNTLTITKNGLAAGDYYIRISPNSAPDNCSYATTASIATPAEANDVEENGSPLTASAMTENGFVNGHIGYRYNGGTFDQNDYYVFTTTSDGAITINYSNLVGAYNTVELYDVDGVTLLGSSSNYGSVSFNTNGLAAGTYYVRVNYYNSFYFAGYTLSNSVTPADYTNDAEDNGTAATALDIAENGTAYGHIGYRYNGGNYDVDDYYKLVTTTDGTVSTTFVNATGDYNTIQIYDNDGTTLLATSSNYGSATASFGNLAAGTYYIRLNYYGSTYYNAYTLTNTVTPADYTNDVEDNGTAATALDIAENGTAYGHIGYRYNGGNYDVDDYYKLVTTTDGAVSATFVNATSDYNTIQIYDNDGTTLLATSTNYGSATASFGNLAAGTYYIRLNYYSATYYNSYTLTNTVTPADYTNDVEDNGTAATALDIAENGTAYGHIGYRYNGGNYDVDDYYKLVTTTDGAVSATFVNATSDYNTIQIYDNDGTTLLATSTNYGSATASFGNLAAGTYYIKLNYYSTTYYNSYTLTNTVTPAAYTNDVEENGTAATAVAMLTNSTVTGHIAYYNNGGTYDLDDYYVFTTYSAGNITLTMDKPSGNYNTLQLVNTDGVTVLNSVSSYGSISVTHNSLPAGTYYVRINYYSTSYYTGYQLTNAFCPDAITILAEGETTFCEGESVTLSTQDHHLNYLWSDGSITEQNAVTLTGEYSLTTDDGGGCIRTSNTISSTSTPLPVAVINADGPTSFCAGGSVTLSVPAGPDSYMWSNGATTPTITVSSTGDYSVQVFKNSCTAISDPIHVTVNSNPIASISASGPLTFCDGGSVTLTASAGSSYLWSSGEETPSIDVTSTGSHYVTITNAAGCSATSATTSVTVNSNPTATISADGPTEFCSGGSVNLMASAGASYLWSNGATSASIAVAISGDYSVTVTNGSGCSTTSDATTVIVNACGGEVTIVAEGPTTFCDGGSVILTSSIATGNVWSNGETTQSITVSTDGDYYCVNGANTSNTIQVVVNANPDATITPDGPTTFCDGGNVMLSAITGYDSYLWSDGSTTHAVAVNASGSYTVTVTNAGCSSTSETTIVTESDPITVSVSASSNQINCLESPVVLSATSATATAYQWKSGGTDILGATEATYSTSTGGYFSCVVSNGSCTASSNVVKVKDIKRLAISPAGTVPICFPSTVTLTATYSASATYQWYKNGNLIIGATSYTFTATNPGKYTVTAAKDGCTRPANTVTLVSTGCKMIDSETAVEVYPNPAGASFNLAYTIEHDGNVQILITDLTGKVIAREIKSLTAGDYNDMYNTDNFAAGIYLVTLQEETGRISQLKLVIEK